jgi:hypothetical protein
MNRSPRMSAFTSARCYSGFDMCNSNSTTKVMNQTHSDTTTMKRSTNEYERQELIRMATAADDLAARCRPDDNRWHAFRARAYNYRKLAQEI